MIVDIGFDCQITRLGNTDVELLTTPGSPNSRAADNAPPNIRKVSHTPQQPKDNEEVIILGGPVPDVLVGPWGGRAMRSR